MDEYEKVPWFLIGHYLQSLDGDRAYPTYGYQHKMKDGKMDRKAKAPPRGHNHKKRAKNKQRRQAIKKQRRAA